MSKNRKGRVNGVRIEKTAVPPRSQYPFATLDIGQSFVEDDLSKEGSLRASASRAGKKLSRTFRVVSETTDDKKQILRCGRTA